MAWLGLWADTAEVTERAATAYWRLMLRNKLRSEYRAERCANSELMQLDNHVCPDCGIGPLLTDRSRGRRINYACGQCGAEFLRSPYYGKRNSDRGKPNRYRLKYVFGINVENE